MHRTVLVFLLLAVICIVPRYAEAQHNATNVLYAGRPNPVFIGVEVGTGLTFWQNATPTYFTTNYPYSATADTIHVRFPSGYTPLFGFFAGISGDFALSKNWGILAKLNYNERRGNWKNTVSEDCDMGTSIVSVPVTSDLTELLRCASAELYARYAFHSLHDFYVGAGAAYTLILNDHYDLNQSIDGPPECTFQDFSTGQGTGIQAYGIGGKNDGLATGFGELKFLAGLPIHIGYRWTVSPEVTVGVPFTGLFTTSKQNEYRANGIGSTISPLTVTGLIALRYQFQ